MKVEELNASALKHEYKVTVDAASINEVTEAKLKRVGAKAKIPGFRPGKIPLNVLQQRYGKSVMGEAIEESVQQAAQDIVRDKKLKPALQPKIAITEYKDGGDLEFTMTVEVLPKLPEFSFDKIELERLTFDIDEKEVEESISRLSERNKSYDKRPEGAKAQTGDVVVIDFLGKKDGVAFEGGAAQHFRLTLGSGQFIPGFEEQLTGVKAGEEKTLKVTFPKEYHKEDLAGAPVEFDVKVHEVLESKPLPVDDAFAAKLGFENIAKLKEAIREQLGREYTGAQRQKLKKQLFDALEEQHGFEVPQGMLDIEFDTIWGRMQEAKQRGEIMMDKSEEELRKEYKDIAARRVRLGLILADIGQKEKIGITREEITQAVLEQARQFPGQEKRIFEFYQKNPKHVEDLRGPILEEKAVDYILSKVKMKDRKVSIEELVKEDEEENSDKKKSSKTAKKNQA